MTVTANTTRNAYTAGNQQNTYAYTFQIHDASDLKVYIGDELKSLNTHYTVTGVGSGTGGSVVFDLGVDGNGEQIYIPQDTRVSIFLAMDLDRDTNYQPSGAFLASTVNNDFDRLWLASNQQQTDINRTVRLQDLDAQSNMTLPLLADRADTLLGFSASISGARPIAVTNNSSQWDSAYNNSITGMQFQSGGILRLSQQDGSDYTVDLDGRYHLIGTDIPDADISESSVTQHRTAMLDLADNERIKLGNSDDLQIYHNGSYSFIQDVGQGSLALLGTDLIFSNGDGSKNYITCANNASVQLFNDGVPKFATNNNGVEVTGTLEFDGLKGTGSVTITDILDEDNMASDSATALATQQSIKAYVDANAGGSSQWTASGSDIYYNTGNVGIGTDNPTSPLDIRGSVNGNLDLAIYNQFDDDDEATPNPSTRLYLSAASNNGYLEAHGSPEDSAGLHKVDLGSTAVNSFLTFSPSYTERMRIDSSGDVLIGGTQKQSPSGIDKGLFIQSQTNGDVVGVNLYSNELNNNRRADFFLDDTNGIYGVQSTASTGLPDFVIKSGSNERFRVTNAGNVGIGTDDPDTKLHVSGGDLKIVSDNANTGEDGIPSILFGEITGADAHAQISYHGDDEVNDANYLGLGVFNPTALNADTLAEQKLQNTLAITRAGKVGIGTTDPQEELHISAHVPKARLQDVDGTNQYGEFFHSNGTTSILARNNTSDGTIVFQKYDGTTTDETMRINSSGNVGIGTNNPLHKVDIMGDASTAYDATSDDGQSNHDATLQVFNKNTTDESFASLVFRNRNSGVGISRISSISKGSGTTDMAFVTENSNTKSEKLRIKADGKVGIGTSSPVAPLQVNGTIYAEGGTFDAPDDGNPPSGADNIDNIAFVMPRDNKIAFWHDGYVRTLLHQDPQGVTQIGQTGTNYITGIKLNCGQSGDVTIQNTDGDAGLTVEGALTSSGLAYPTADGNANQVIVTDGSGTLSFADQSGGISNVSEDTAPQLGGDLDAQDNEINNVDKLGINTSSPSVACDVQFVKTGDFTAGLRVHTSAATSYDGKVITWGEQTAERGVLGWADGYGVTSCYIASGTAGLRFQTEFGSSPRVIPCRSTGDKNDNAIDLGMSNARFDDIYATNTSIISSSDSTLKQDIEELTDAEERVAVACKGLLRKFRWRDAVEEKGDDARIHFGIMAQDLRDAFTAEGLDAGRYGMFISNTWWEHEGEHYPTSESAPEGATEVTRLGVRYTELLAFIISAI
jgi:hypothetical protein